MNILIFFFLLLSTGLCWYRRRYIFYYWTHTYQGEENSSYKYQEWKLLWCPHIYVLPSFSHQLHVYQHHSPHVLLWVLSPQYKLPYCVCAPDEAFPVCVLLADEIRFLTFFCNKANQHLFEEKESITKHSYQSYQNIKRKYSACLPAYSVVFLWLPQRHTSVRLPAGSPQLPTYRHKIG